MKKTILDYIKENNEEEKVLVQAKVPKSLCLEVREALSETDITWNDFMTACLKQFLDENRRQL